MTHHEVRVVLIALFANPERNAIEPLIEVVELHPIHAVLLADSSSTPISHGLRRLTRLLGAMLARAQARLLCRSITLPLVSTRARNAAQSAIISTRFSNRSPRL